MKTSKLFFLGLWLCSTRLYAQDTPLAYLERFFENLAPCGPPVYCYDYTLQTDDKHLIITTKLYNYEGQTKQQTLTQQTTYKVPVDRIKNVEYFPYNGQEVYIFTVDPDIEKRSNNEVEHIDFFPLDFNQNQLDEERKESFKSNFEALLNNLSRR